MNARSIQPLRDQQVRQAVEEHQVGLGPDRQVKRGGHRRLGPPRIDDDDLGLRCGSASPAPRGSGGRCRRSTRPGRCSPTPRGPGRCKAGRRTRTLACRPRRTSPCTGGYCRRRGRCPCRTWPGPRAGPSPRWRSGPVLRKAIESSPWAAWIARKRAVIAVNAVCQSTGRLGRRRPSGAARSRGRRLRGRSGPPSPSSRPCRD